MSLWNKTMMTSQFEKFHWTHLIFIKIIEIFVWNAIYFQSKDIAHNVCEVFTCIQIGNANKT